MSLLKLAWKNIIANRLQLFLNLILFALGIGLIYFLFNFNEQIKNKFENNLAGIDMVLGAKGSALQLILCNMYHIDNPTGNIKVQEAKPFLNPKHPMIEAAYPISTGDSYKGYRIIGTERGILELYNAELREGKLWNGLYQATVGSNVASKLGLKLGDQFHSSHGFMDDDDFKHEHGEFKVVGILNQSGTVLDQLILCNTESVWDVHDHDHEEEEISELKEKTEHEEEEQVDEHAAHDHHDHHDHDHEHHHQEDHAGHDHHDHHDHDHEHHHHEELGENERENLLNNLDKEITAVLVKFKNRKSYQALSMPRNIKENTELMAASPGYEINKLFDMIGIGTKALRMLAYLIGFVSFLSIFISMLNALRNRKYELALIRVMGASPSSLFILILLEGVILAILGFIIGIAVSYLGAWMMTDKLSEAYQYNFNAFQYHPILWYLLAVSILIGLLAAAIPAFMAYKTNIHKTLLSQKS